MINKKRLILTRSEDMTWLIFNIKFLLLYNSVDVSQQN